jgi:hydroxymethylpyrimidine/phosphomethylpyrimidine kinase
MIPKALTIAGSDSGGGAGIQADLKTFAALGVYGCSVITAVTAQNTEQVTGIFDLSPEAVQKQMEAVLSDISPQAIKTGMLSNAGIIQAIRQTLHSYPPVPLVVDPVMVAKSGDTLLNSEAVQALCDYLLPIATVLTPNLPEAEVLTGKRIQSEIDCVKACEAIFRLGPKIVVLKGGHRPRQGQEGQQVVDLFYDGQTIRRVEGPFIDTPHTHGTGCTLASAITAGLAKGLSPFDAVMQAREYLTETLRHAYAVGRGKSPVHHFYRWWKSFGS